MVSKAASQSGAEGCRKGMMQERRDAIRKGCSRVGNLLCALSLFTLSLEIALLNSDRERIAIVALYKRVMRVTRANPSLTKSDVSDSLVF